MKKTILIALSMVSILTTSLMAAEKSNSESVYSLSKKIKVIEQQYTYFPKKEKKEIINILLSKPGPINVSFKAIEYGEQDKKILNVLITKKAEEKMITGAGIGDSKKDNSTTVTSSNGSNSQYTQMAPDEGGNSKNNEIGLGL